MPGSMMRGMDGADGDLVDALAGGGVNSGQGALPSAARKCSMAGRGVGVPPVAVWPCVSWARRWNQAAPGKFAESAG